MLLHLLAFGASQKRRAPAYLRPLSQAWLRSPQFSAGAERRREREFALGRDERGFERLGPPRAGEWLAENAEPGQTVAEYRASRFNARSDRRHTVLLQPLADLPPGPAEMLVPAIREYLSIYFATDVEALAPAPVAASWSDERGEQADAGALVADLAEAMPPRGLALLGVTGGDIFVRTDEFNFGYALLREHAGVASMSRFAGEPDKLLRRMLLVASHELAHALSLHHCVHYRCAMNGAVTLEELDRVPLHVCPVCSAKLQENLHFDPRERYRNLERFYRKYRLEPEADFAAARAAELAR